MRIMITLYSKYEAGSFYFQQKQKDATFGCAHQKGKNAFIETKSIICLTITDTRCRWSSTATSALFADTDNGHLNLYFGDYNL